MGLSIPVQKGKSKIRAHQIPSGNPDSSKTLNATNFRGFTSSCASMRMIARENPHCGVSGVPFMKSTIGAAATALGISSRLSCERRRVSGHFRKPELRYKIADWSMDRGDIRYMDLRLLLSFARTFKAPYRCDEQ